MAATLRSWVYRRGEDRLVAAVRCLDCGAPRGERCRYRGRERVTCCQARADFGAPILLADVRFRLLLAEFGLLDLSNALTDHPDGGV
jgi:hypothetical protein